MSMTVGDHILQRLTEWGVTRIFGFPGDGINGIYGALNRAIPRFKYIQARHEEMAAFMACAHAKFTGEPGVVLATSGPGAAHLLTGMYDAKLDHQPLVAIVGQQARASLGGHFLQEIDLPAMFKDVASDYVQMITTPVQTRHIIDRALRIAVTKRTVTCVIVPNDVQEMDAVETPPRAHGALHSGKGVTFPTVVPREADLQEAADILNSGKRVAILVGAGALFAADEVIEVADLLGAGVAKALLGKAALADDLPFVTGSIGLLGTNPSWELMSECDTLLMIGSRFPYSEYLPKEGQARGVQIDIDPAMHSMRYPMELNLTGDSGETLRALIPLLERKTERKWREKIEASIREWWKILEARAMSSGNPINPQRVFWELSPRLPDDTILCADSGSSANWFARDLKIRPGMKASVSGTLASMGCAVPYAIAAKSAYPNRVVIAMAGDGAMQMNGNSELITIARYWKDWSDPRLIVLVLNNRDLNQVSWEQRILTGDPKFELSQDVPEFPYARYAELLGLRGIRVDDPEKIGDAWEQALSADRPVVLEAITDPNIAALPPHISFEQAKAFVSSIIHGDPDSSEIIIASAKQLMDTVAPDL